MTTVKRGVVTRALVATCAALVLLLAATSQASGPPDADAPPRSMAGQPQFDPTLDTGTLLPVGYRVTPAGAQSPLGDLPLSLTPFPDRAAVLVVNAGHGVQSLQVVDVRTGTVEQTVRYHAPEALFVGAAFSPDGRRAYVSAGGNNKIRTFDVTGDRLTETAPIQLPTRNPAGATVNPYPAGLAVTPDGRHLVVADSVADAVTVVDLPAGATRTVAAGHAPYGVAISADGATAYVSDQGGSTVCVVDVAEAAVRATVTVGLHPNRELLDPRRHLLYVADGDSDQISVVDTATNVPVRTIGLAPYPGAEIGSNPDALALSADGATLYVANSGNNDVAVLDLAAGRIRGLVPTGWYPAALSIVDGQLLVANAKGLGSGPNAGTGVLGSTMTGTLSRIEVPAPVDRLARWSAQVRYNDGFDQRGAAVTGTTSVLPRTPLERSPIQHVIYVVRENRTYDQELGSLGRGNGDPSLNLFGEESAPNTRALARRFSTLDNFYADAEVSAQGWNWVVAGNSNEYTEQTWAAHYSGRNHPYPSENDDPAIAPQQPDDAYIWQRLARAGVSFRNYGFYVSRDATGQFVAGDPVLNARTDHAVPWFDLACPDSAPRANPCGTSRFAEWKKEFDQYVAGDDLPTVELVRLPNDHTAGTAPGQPTPRAFVADNDWALGQLVDTVSHSPYWSSTAIFVTEDDAQNGTDHVDAHRTIALVISPYTQTGRVDSSFYSTDSMLRTIELLTGLRPLTQFDAYATPMIGSFTNQPNLGPYDAIRPVQPLDELNSRGAPLAAQSAAQDLTTEDKIDEQVFNEAIWKSVRGADARMPAPRHTVWDATPDTDDD